MRILDHSGRTLWASPACICAHAQWDQLAGPSHDSELIHGDDIGPFLDSLRYPHAHCATIRWWGRHKRECPAGATWVHVDLSFTPITEDQTLIVAERIRLHCGLSVEDVNSLHCLPCPASSVQRPASSVQRPASSVQRPASSVPENRLSSQNREPTQ